MLSDSSMTMTTMYSYPFKEVVSTTVRLSGGGLLDGGRGISRA